MIELGLCDGFFAADRRIRVHTLCIPVTSSLQELMASADHLAITGLLAKMGEHFVYWFSVEILHFDSCFFVLFSRRQVASVFSK